MTTLALVTEQTVADIVRLGMARAPNEACGLIVGNSVVEIENQSESPHDSFQIDGPTVFDTLKSCGFEEGEVIVWHTHPSGFVGPSLGDLQHRLEGVKYLVVSLPSGEAVQY